ncbi:SMEK domain-containing protein [Chryseobacterium sp. OV279]|uniref:SMEK domain-containing protein n=1 Tax=Chryseobacterium sp. OV279 TaxID=1500285 RepID=UPI00091BDE3B|nr:SMEK domain-containing protein [Chryseobacterium sp. OV279]SHE95612.1 hypothetical protein SAMN02787100_1219 [Chryseobacterium sp. OV279]
MINTGKKLEEIISMLNNFRSEIGALSSLGLLNINKHAENFIKRILNLTFNLELDNLNDGKSNYPGLDLGDTYQNIAFQITATKTSEKIDETLKTCLKFKHYEVFSTIKVFILTSKQTSYTIKTNTEPHFLFSFAKNIIDFDDLFKTIEHLDPIKMNALFEYLKIELKQTVDALHGNDIELNECLLETVKTRDQLGLNNHCHWQANLKLISEKISVPEIHRRLNEFLPNAATKNMYLATFNEILRKSHSRTEIAYESNPEGTHDENYYYGNALQIRESSISIERVNYTDREIFLNLLPEMISLITSILFFAKYAKGNFEIEITIQFESNTTLYFNPVRSLVHEQVFNTFILDSPFNLALSISDVHVETLTDLLQKIMDAFIAKGTSIISSNPFFEVKRDTTGFVIGNIKSALDVQ